MLSGAGSLIAFATAPGAVASDNGFYSQYLIEALHKPGLRILDVFQETANGVIRASQGRQTPWFAASVTGDFVFHDPRLAEGKLADLKTQIDRLEAERKTAEEAVRKARTEQERRDAEARAQRAQSDLTARTAEEERLARESAREREIAAETAKLDAEAKDRAAALEREVQASEEQLRKLRQTETAGSTAGMNLEAARARVAELEKRLITARATVAAARKKAQDKLTADYAPLRARLQDPVKDEFETTADFTSRREAVRKQREQLEAKFAVEKAAVDKDYDAQAETAANGASAEMDALRKQTYLDYRPAKWMRYDADSGRLYIEAAARTLAFAVPLSDARTLSARRDNLTLLNEASFDGKAVGAVKLVDRGSGISWLSASLRAGETRMNEKDGLTYVWIPPGSFMMGCSPADSQCSDTEKPAHKVTLTRGYWMGQTPVTQEAYQRLTGNPSHFKGAKLPVETISWISARGYCEAVGMRLPTEAEWEYAARAGTTAGRYGEVDEIAWYTLNSGDKTHEVGQKAPNAWGLYDMLGNVYQWTADWAGEYAGRDEIDPLGPASGQLRILRGGSWGGASRTARASYRISFSPGTDFSYIGIRCVGD